MDTYQAYHVSEYGAIKGAHAMVSALQCPVLR